MQRITFAVECGRDTPGAYWVFGGDFYEVPVTVIAPDEFDADSYTDDEISEMADNQQYGIRWATEGAKE